MILLAVFFSFNALLKVSDAHFFCGCWEMCLICNGCTSNPFVSVDLFVFARKENFSNVLVMTLSLYIYISYGSVLA